jgi:hypothetical protein
MAISSGIPTVIAVAANHFMDWVKFSEGMSVELACDVSSLHHWWASTLHRPNAVEREPAPDLVLPSPQQLEPTVTTTRRLAALLALAPSVICITESVSFHRHKGHAGRRASASSKRGNSRCRHVRLVGLREPESMGISKGRRK